MELWDAEWRENRVSCSPGLMRGMRDREERFTCLTSMWGMLPACLHHCSTTSLLTGTIFRLESVVSVRNVRYVWWYIKIKKKCYLCFHFGHCSDQLLVVFDMIILHNNKEAKTLWLWNLLTGFKSVTNHHHCWQLAVGQLYFPQQEREKVPQRLSEPKNLVSIAPNSQMTVQSHTGHIKRENIGNRNRSRS